MPEIRKKKQTFGVFPEVIQKGWVFRQIVKDAVFSRCFLWNLFRFNSLQKNENVL